jgi:hypothetical protein
MNGRSCSNCINDCKVTRYGPKWACGAWRAEPKECQFISSKGTCLAQLSKTKRAIPCKDVETCTMRLNLLNGGSR